MIGGAFVGILAATAPFVFIPLRSSLPYMATPGHKVEKALKFISQRTRASAASSDGKACSVDRAHRTRQYLGSNNKKLNFVDLGSGDGTAILAAASLGWNATGVELNPTLWFVSFVRRLFSSRIIRSNSRLVMGDMFESKRARGQLRGADCVMIFGVNPLMPKIADLVQRECRTGCFLMSYRFRVPLLQLNEKAIASTSSVECSGRDAVISNKTSPQHGVSASMIYDVEEMRIYELDDVTETKAAPRSACSP